jgi:hypothetical protein
MSDSLPLAVECFLCSPFLSEQSEREKNDRADQFKRAFYCDAYKPERQQYQPHYRIKNEREEGQRPA